MLLSWENVGVFKHTNKNITGYEILTLTENASYDDFQFYAPGPYAKSYLILWIAPGIIYTFQVIAICEGSEKVLSTPVSHIIRENVVRSTLV